MTRHTFSFLILALIIASPAQASHRHVSETKTVAKAPSPTPQPVSAPVASSKGTRLVPNSLLPGKVEAKKVAAAATPKPAAKPSAPAKVAQIARAALAPLVRLARLTAYWTQEDPWTAKHQSSTGVRLHEGHCAVDPKLIPYGSMVQIPGMGNYVAVDTGSAVISREAAIGSGRTDAQRNALVVDLFFENRKDAEAFASHGPSYVAVSWDKPLASADAPLNPRALPAVPKIPAGTVYMLAQAPSLADSSVPLAFRKPQM